MQSSDETIILAELKIKGPFEFTLEKITSAVPSNSTCNFLLGYVNYIDNEFRVLYTGYTKNLRAELKKHLHKFSHFNFLTTDTLKSAYENECMLYHTIKDYTFLINKGHPKPPKGENWNCPLCDRNELE